MMKLSNSAAAVLTLVAVATASALAVDDTVAGNMWNSVDRGPNSGEPSNMDTQGWTSSPGLNDVMAAVAKPDLLHNERHSSIMDRDTTNTIDSGDLDILKRRLSSIAADCTLCTSSTDITDNGSDFQALVASCIDIGGTCPTDVPIGCWDTSAVTDMSFAFSQKALFDDSINCWNTANVNNMEQMFNQATEFNQPLDDWDVSSVTDMNRMFNDADNFNQLLNDWNVASVTDMIKMFYIASNFNKPLDDWNVSSVNTMYKMFAGASVFDKPLNDWNVASVTNIGSMFYNAPDFNQCLSSWADKTPSNVNRAYLFLRSGCPNTENLSRCQGDNEQCYAPSEIPSTVPSDFPSVQPSTVPSGLSTFGEDPSIDCSVAYSATQPIDKFQLKTVGSDLDQAGAPSPVRSFVSKDGLTVVLYYEGHPVYATDDDFIDVTLYTVGTEDDAEATPDQDPNPCNGNGEALIDVEGSALYTVTPLQGYSDDTYNDYFTTPSVDQCFPHTTNGVVVQAEIVMKENPFDTTAGDSSLASKIYDTDTVTLGLEEGQDGRLQFCARIAYYIGDDDAKELISYLDTKVVIDVSLLAEIEFTQSVAISSSDQTVNTVNQDVSTAIEVDSFLCGDPEENGGAPYAEDYSLGQAFRVCVDVKTDDQDKFRLANFGEVTCSPDTTDSESETIIVSLVNDVATATSILTSLFDNDATVGAKSFGSSPTVASAQAISFSTVLTNAYFTGEAETLACTGSVDVETVAADTVPADALLTGQEFCDDYANGYGGGTMYYIDAYQVCCSLPEDSSCNAGEETVPNCTADYTTFQIFGAFGACTVPDANTGERRQLVSFTVPNPMASSSASSRRRMDEETGASAADFGAIIKLSSSSSSFAASGPFPLWATTTTTLVIALMAGWSL